MDLDLYEAGAEQLKKPLAYAMRPRKLDDFVGQEHIVGPGRLLRRAIQGDQLSSLIFYGPPGTGKTTLARIIAGTTKSHFVALNAVLSGVSELRKAIEEAKRRLALYHQRTILFVDEVHRWNKSQQDALLPWVENGTVILIGATTENPFFEVNAALVSRSRLFGLKALDTQDLIHIAELALADTERGYGSYRIELDEGVIEHLAEVASGDARTMLNALQLAVETTPLGFPPPKGSSIHVTMEIAEESIQERAVLYDKEGDYHFDIISAFIKSIRGSDPDAALYWLARMLGGGESPRYIFRRLLISASEDVGLADPQALGVVEAAAATFDRIGLPEGHFALSQATLYLATAPKSNSTMALFDAMQAVSKEELAVPKHLKDGNRDKENFGHGEHYLYPHAYRDHWVAQSYLPSSLKGRVFYQPSDIGYEGTLAETISERREAQLRLEDADDHEILSFSYTSKKEADWLRRLYSDNHQAIVAYFYNQTETKFQRHDRVLIAQSYHPQIVGEALLNCPEGGVFVLPQATTAPEFWQMSTPPIRVDNLGLFGSLPAYKDIAFEHIRAQHLLIAAEDPVASLVELSALLAPEGELKLWEPLPERGMRLSQLMKHAGYDHDETAWVQAHEEAIFAELAAHSLVATLEAGFAELSAQGQALEGYKLSHSDIEEQGERWVDAALIEKWLAPESVCAKLLAAQDAERYERLKSRLPQKVGTQRMAWTRAIARIELRAPAARRMRPQAKTQVQAQARTQKANTTSSNTTSASSDEDAE